MKTNAEYLLRDPEYYDQGYPYYDGLDIDVHGDHIYGEIYVPGTVYEAPHPCVCLFHGVPGTANNDDIAQALRRAGFVVIRVHHRGSWGSQGYYSFSNCIEDAVVTAEWAISDAADKYQIDPDRVFFVGHSNGGNTVINALRRLPWVKTAAVIAPYDHEPAFERNELDVLHALVYEECRVLRLTSFDDLFNDSRDNCHKWRFPDAAEDLKDRNLLMIGGALDDIASPELMIDPLWEALKKQKTDADHQRVIMSAGHGFDNCRIKLIEVLGSWLCDKANK